MVVEVPKLKLPFNCSIKITDFKNDFFLYPYNIVETLKKINRDIKSYENRDKSSNLIDFISAEVIDTDKEAVTYFISEFVLNLDQEGVEIFEDIKNHFKFLLNLFSLLLRELLFIKKAYIFKKKSSFFKFVRFIKIPIFHKETSGIHRLFEFISRRDLEMFFPVLLLRLKKAKYYLPFIEEFLFSQIRAGNIIIKFMVSWNTLEHLTNIYWKLLKKTKLFPSNKNKKITKVIKKVINTFNEKDIEFPYISLKEIKRRASFYNRPAIKILIFELCKRIHLKLAPDEILSIKQVHYIRNKLFHSVYSMQEFTDDFTKEFKLKKFQTKEIMVLS